MSKLFQKVCSIGEASRIGSAEWAFLCSCLRLYPREKTTTRSRSIYLGRRARDPRSEMRQTARILYLIYIVLTVIEIILLVIGGMPFFDSLLNSFATAGTGGFGIKNASIGAYDSYYLQGVIGVFMLLFGVNFNIYYLLLARDFKLVFKNEELRFYIITVLVSVTVIAINIRSMFSSWFDAFHHSFFQVSSIITTTGFSTTDFSLWPELSRYILVVLMLMGACAGSTGGGIKTSTFLALIQGMKAAATNQSEKAFHNAIPRDAFRKAAVITLLAMSVVVLGTWAMALLEPQVPLMDALFEVTSAFGTVGLSTGITPSLGVGAKLLSILIMYIGRLGPLTVASLWYFSRGERISYPEGNLSIG